MYKQANKYVCKMYLKEDVAQKLSLICDNMSGEDLGITIGDEVKLAKMVVEYFADNWNEKLLWEITINHKNNVEAQKQKPKKEKNNDEIKKILKKFKKVFDEISKEIEEA